MGSGNGEGRVGWEGECRMDEGEREGKRCHLFIYSLRDMWGVWVLLAYGFRGLRVQACGLTGTDLWA